MPWERLARMVRVAHDAAIVVGRGRLIRLCFDRPPDDVDEPCQRDLQGEHQPDESPSHVARSYPYWEAMSRPIRLRCRVQYPPRLGVASPPSPVLDRRHRA